jgi:hypothetical protein
MTAGRPDGKPPVLFALGLHLHQPVGNFDWVFEQHVAQVYRPLLHEIVAGGAAPSSLHLSGPLLDWLERHHAGFLDELGRWVSDGRVELLLAGYDEPILVTLTREDRLEQIGRMREALQARFGVVARGLWLTERVWEPHLPGDLHEAGVEYALVDDRHFLVAGFERAALHQPWRTEDEGRSLDLFPIDQQLRYLVPFRPPSEFADYLRGLASGPAARRPALAVLADDGEKFGGWPGTFEWVYQKGWLQDFLATLDRLREAGEVRLVTFSEALAEIPPRGIAYLPSASYHEMEGWALPTPAARRLAALEAELGEARLKGPEGALLRGSHWRNFFAKYAEANRMHKKMLALSRLCRERGDPPRARRAIGRAQCNDAYWHGVFGGLYLPHLRHAIWHELGQAEAELRRGEALAWETADYDCDGESELLVHSRAVSAVLSPARGAALEELSDLATFRNHAAALTRRREPYHEPLTFRGAGPSDTETVSIHNIDRRLDTLPPVDLEVRAIFQERIWAADLTVEGLVQRTLEPLHSWASEPATSGVRPEADALVFSFEFDRLTKTIRVHADGRIELTLAWQNRGWPADAWFTTELSLGHPLTIEAPRATEWRHPIETVAQSESGLDRTGQGESVTLGWPVGAGAARVTLSFPR